MSEKVLPARETSFKGDVLRLVSGTTAAQGIALLSAPILTRLYAPEAFGMLAMFVSLAGILGGIACMRYEQAILLPKEDHDAANLFGASLLFSLLMGLLTLPAVLWGGRYFLHWVNMPELAPYLLLLPFMVLLHGMLLAFRYWNTRMKRYAVQSVSTVAGRLSAVISKLSVGGFGHATGGALIASEIGGQVVVAGVLGNGIARHTGAFLSKNVTWNGMCAGIRRYKRFPAYSSLSTLLNVASWQVPVVLLGVFFSPAVVGFYALGFRILQLPMHLIGSAIGQVFFQRAADAKRDGTLPALVEQTFQKLVVFSIWPMLILGLAGRHLYAWVFGSEWAEAGAYVEILAPWAFFWLVTSPLSTLINALERQAFGLRFDICLMITRLASIVTGGYLADIWLALGLYSASGVVLYGILGYVLMRAAGVTGTRMASILFRSASMFFPALPVVLFLLRPPVDVMHMVVLLAFGAIYGAGVLWFTFEKKFTWTCDVRKNSDRG